MKKTIPDKLYFKIGEVAKLVDVPTHVLRYWESEFTDIKPKRTNSKQRLYRRQDVKFVMGVKSLLHDQGYTIAGARKYLESGKEIKQPVQEVRSLDIEFSQKLAIIKLELKKLQSFLAVTKG